MQNLLLYAAVFSLALGAAITQPAGPPENQSLSLDQRGKVSEIITARQRRKRMAGRSQRNGCG